MYYGLSHNTENIGDEIQTYALHRLLPETSGWLPRDHVGNVQLGDAVRLAVCGWLTHHPENWPPKGGSKPLLIGIHLGPQGRHSNVLEYLREHEPVGCRDLATCHLLHRHGIDAYLSGCVSLTLPEYQGKRSGETLIVDLPGPLSNADSMRAIDLGPSVSILTHQHRIRSRSERMQYATGLLSRYARAKLVITGRLHCVLPCMAIGTPVVLVEHNKDDLHDRLSGLDQMLWTISQEDFALGRFPFDLCHPPHPCRSPIWLNYFRTTLTNTIRRYTQSSDRLELDKH